LTATELVLAGAGLVVLLGVFLVVAGVVVAWGVAPALMTAGVLLSVVAVAAAVVLLRDDGQ